MNITVIGARETAASFIASALALQYKSRQAVEITARKVKDSAKQRASGFKHLPHYPRSIGYDLHGGPGAVWAEIGPDNRAAQWGLGRFIEFGTPTSGPHPHMGPALVENEADFTRGMLIAVTEAIR
ncbi:hypothetical protein O1L44_16300 [Streptomyces noursei]|uniref:hypothetical protein n=1 Tax=Streptomyces noursei TaxID=1971 RepID=UPI00081C3E95|nr:hypothetical protein SNOUR_20850 [Streptomyces noursei ATCC 11455]MCZ0994351.1 hypothetical protein [Streptomyces noursei]